MIEIWKPIINYEGLYEISNYGKIKRFNRDKRYKSFKILKPQKTNKYGHKHIDLTKNNIRDSHLVHRLVLETFVGPCPLGMECRHLDGNPSNNRLDNLRWGTRLENMQDTIKHGTNFIKARGSKHRRAKLNEWKVRVIIRLLGDGYMTQQEIAKIFNISRPIISRIKNNITWKSVRGY